MESKNHANWAIWLNKACVCGSSYLYNVTGMSACVSGYVHLKHFKKNLPEIPIRVIRMSLLILTKYQTQNKLWFSFGASYNVCRDIWKFMLFPERFVVYERGCSVNWAAYTYVSRNANVYIYIYMYTYLYMYIYTPHTRTNITIMTVNLKETRQVFGKV